MLASKGDSFCIMSKYEVFGERLCSKWRKSLTMHRDDVTEKGESWCLRLSHYIPVYSFLLVSVFVPAPLSSNITYSLVYFLISFFSISFASFSLRKREFKRNIGVVLLCFFGKSIKLSSCSAF